MKIFITGGAGFVGSTLALRFKEQYPTATVVCFDNLRRRGAELNLARFAQAGVAFQHGDVRLASDLEEVGGTFDWLIDCSAEPSVLAGYGTSSRACVETNLAGTHQCLEWAKQRAGGVIFLSTSRVYAIPALRALPLREGETRLDLAEGPGYTGIAESFSTRGTRSLYGSAKLASELLVEEYAHAFNLRAVINRCGVIVGPGQFGKVDQGVFTLWLARHHFGKPLQYNGFGGQGKQVRDLLHPADLFDLLEKQMQATQLPGDIYNVGGGRARATSLAELTALCRKLTGRTVEITAQPETHPVDVPWFITDAGRVETTFGWQPKRALTTIFEEIHEWIRSHEPALRALF